MTHTVSFRLDRDLPEAFSLSPFLKANVSSARKFVDEMPESFDYTTGDIGQGTRETACESAGDLGAE